MPSERARPLVAFAAVAVVCALVIAVNMLRHPTAMLTTVEASPVSELGPRVEFGTVLGSRPEEEARPAPNVLALALARAAVAPSPAQHSSEQRSSSLRASTALRARRAHVRPTNRHTHARPSAHSPARSSAHAPARTPRHHPTTHHVTAGHPGKGHGHGRHRGHERGASRYVPSTPGLRSAPGHSGRAPGHAGQHGHTTHRHADRIRSGHGRSEHGYTLHTQGHAHGHLHGHGQGHSHHHGRR